MEVEVLQDQVIVMKYLLIPGEEEIKNKKIINIKNKEIDQEGKMMMTGLVERIVQAITLDIRVLLRFI